MPRQSISRLAGKQLYDLQTFTRDNYAEKKISDPEFAEFASKELGFTVSKGNIKGAREAFGITATSLVKREPTTIIERIEAIEAWIKKFES